MNVSDIINLMGTLSIGNDNITSTEKSIYLQYLNLAHFDLYAATANLNQNLLINETISNTIESNEIVLSNTPFLVNNVYIPSIRGILRRVSLVDILNYDPNFNNIGIPNCYFIKNNKIVFYPSPSNILEAVVWYLPNPKPFTLETLEEDIPYHIALHHILADGGLYYVFLDVGGFKSSQKENEAKERWEKGKSKLISYLYNSSGQTFSTFSNV